VKYRAAIFKSPVKLGQENIEEKVPLEIKNLTKTESM